MNARVQKKRIFGSSHGNSRSGSKNDLRQYRMLCPDGLGAGVGGAADGMTAAGEGDGIGSPSRDGVTGESMLGAALRVAGAPVGLLGLAAGFIVTVGVGPVQRGASRTRFDSRAIPMNPSSSSRLSGSPNRRAKSAQPCSAVCLPLSRASMNDSCGPSEKYSPDSGFLMT